MQDSASSIKGKNLVSSRTSVESDLVRSSVSNVGVVGERIFSID